MAMNQVLGGATSGAAAGSALGPWGALGGGLVGGALGFFQDDPEELRKKALGQYQNQMTGAMDQYQASQQGVLNPYSQLYTTEGVKNAQDAFTGAASSANPMQYGVSQSMGQQTYTPALDSWKEYLDPSIAYQQEAARKNVEESAAGQGGLYSGAAAREIAGDVANIGQQGFQQALQNAQNEQSRANQVSTQNLSNAMSAGNYNVGLGQTNIGNLGSVYGTQRDVMDAFSSGMSDLNRARYGGQTSAANAALQAQLAGSSGGDMWGDILNATQAGANIKSLWG
jgi:hypothetical protein